MNRLSQCRAGFLSPMLILSLGTAVALRAQGSVPVKVAALFPKGTQVIGCSERLQMGFMTGLSATAYLPWTWSCNKVSPKVPPRSILLELKAFDVQDEIGRMQAEMTPSTSAKQVETMRKQLEKVRGYWKGMNVGQFTPVREEKVGKGTILMTSYEAPCVDVNPDRSSSREVRLRAYFFNGRTEATVELEGFYTEAEAKAATVSIFDRLDRTDFKDLM